MFRLVSSYPAPLVYVEIPESSTSRDLPFEEYAFLEEVGKLVRRDLNGVTSLYRGVSIDRLATVLQTGIDVTPPDAVFFSDEFFKKAWEYGDLPKLVLVLDPSEVDRTYRRVPIDTPLRELADLRATFPTELRSADGTELWLSRLPPDDRRLATPYEWQYARWLPGDPFKALRAVLAFGRASDTAFSRILLALKE